MANLFLNIQVGDAVETVLVVEEQLADPTVLMQDALLMLIRSTQLTFEAQGRPQRWTPLAMSTIRGRLQKNAGGRAALRAGDKAPNLSGKDAVKAQNQFFAAVGSVQILRDTGALAMGVGFGASGAFETPEGFGESDKFTATLASTHLGAEALQFVIAGGRPFLLIQDVDEEDIMDAAVQFVMATGPYSDAG